MNRKDIDDIAIGIGQGLPFGLRWGGFIATEALRSPSAPLKVADAVLLAAVRHPEWAVAALRELYASASPFSKTPYPVSEMEALADRLVSLAYIERSEQ